MAVIPFRSTSPWLGTRCILIACLHLAFSGSVRNECLRGVEGFGYGVGTLRDGSEVLVAAFGVVG